MDFKALRAAKNKKAQSMIESSGGKVDSSDFTPAEMLNADAKTGMRPISRRAFKTGGKVEGAEAKTNLSRSTRGFKETVGLANTNQKDANEEREGVKHVGGFKNGGAPKETQYSKTAVDKEIAKDKTIGKGGAKLINSLLKGRQKSDEPDNMNKGGRAGYQTYGAVDGARLDTVGPDEGGEKTEPMEPFNGRKVSAKQEAGFNEAQKQQAAWEAEQRAKGDMTRRKHGGKAEKFEGSAKDIMEDKKMAAKHGMSMKEWEASKADDKHDSQQSMKGLKAGGKAEEAHDKECACKACGGSAGYKRGGGLYANINAKRKRGEKMRDAGDKGAPTAEDFKNAKRTARATGGRAGKGTTNISINVMPHTPNKPMGIQPPMPMPPVGGPPPMAPPPPPERMSLPPGLGAAMAGASGAGPMPPPPGAPMPMMGRKSGGKVYPKMQYGSGGGKGRLEKIDEYGKNA
jgi:hypothetical protein